MTSPSNNHTEDLSEKSVLYKAYIELKKGEEELLDCYKVQTFHSVDKISSTGIPDRMTGAYGKDLIGSGCTSSLKTPDWPKAG